MRNIFRRREGDSNHTLQEPLVAEDSESIQNSANPEEPIRKIHHKPKPDAESLEYINAENVALRQYLRNRRPRDESLENAQKWLMSLLIGITTGIVAYGAIFCIDKIYEVKLWLVDGFLVQGDNRAKGIAFLIYVSINLFLALLSSCIIIFVEPAAAGSGIPEVKGYLNGVLVRHAFNIRTLIGKWIGVICSVSASLPVGPEGPLIHNGAAVGGGLGEMRSRTLNLSFPIVEKFRNPRDRREFITAGAATGVAAAFGAPIGGVLFSLEEAASFWSSHLTWRSFFGCMVSVFTMYFFQSGLSGRFDARALVLFQVGSTSYTYTIVELIPFVFLGIIGGLSGASFTWLNLALTRIRRDFVNKRKIFRIIEVASIVLVVSFLSFYLPTFWSCGSEPHNDDPLAHVGTNSTVRYTCPRGEYNEMATLFLAKQEDAVRHLYEAQDDSEFSIQTVILFSFLYFFMAMFTAGSTLSSGLVVPMLLIGASYGRAMGVLLHTIFPNFEIYPATYAIVGSASFLGGVSRMTISMTVILLEITNDLQFLLPIMLAIMVAKWVGDFFTHPFYDCLLELKHIPYLEGDPPFVAKKLSCEEIMSQPILSLSATEEVSNVIEMLRTTNHNGFPVVVNSHDDHTLVGFITRKMILVLLQQQVYRRPRVFEWTELLKLLDLKTKTISELEAEMTEGDMNETINFKPYMNASQVTVPISCTAFLAYQIFRTMGLRHLPVVDTKNQVRGIISRYDLTEHHLLDCYKAKYERHDGYEEVQDEE
eukprot:gb/GECH01012366.1/.p1 GENE.gb/GECH01012366.1/~~gb/GECH01012366.1/.p1  ORF type:complete len:763 (+),score=121.47 gb/GECH01012366.1/:1-2289(+)